jgi:chromosome partitioning protein
MTIEPHPKSQTPPKPPVDFRVLAFANSKGGSWKSTGAVNFAVAAEEAGEKAIIFDCDLSQASAKLWSQQRGDHSPHVWRVSAPKVNLALAKAHAEGAVLVILDLPGRDGVDVSYLLRRADFAIIPAQPTMFDNVAANATRRVLKDLGVGSSVLLTRLNAATTARARGAVDRYSETGAVIDAMIVDRVAIPDAMARGRSVFECAGLGARAAADEVRAAFASTRLLMEAQHG